jgi:dipeptidyl aminopeptidase/acylaminoacyl peptidase
MRRNIRGIVVAVLCAALLAGVAAAQKRPITEKDLLQFTWVADPQVSPDGKQVAFVRVTVNDKKNEYDTAIWLVSAKGGDMRPLTAGPRDSSPQWSPDGTRLAFVRSREEDGKKQPPQIFMLPMGGGEALQVTKLPKGTSRPTWSPDGKTLAFNSTTTPDDMVEAACKERTHGSETRATQGQPPTQGQPEDCKPPEHESDVRVVSRAVYRMNGAGYLDFTHPNHIWTIAVPAAPQEIAHPKQLTSGEFSENGMEWAPDSSKIYFVSQRSLEPYYDLPQNAVYEVPVGGGEEREVTRITGALRSISLSPDGKRLAFFGTLNQPVRSYSKTDLWVADLAGGGAPKNLTASFDWGIGEDILGDQEPPRGGGGERPLWTRDGKGLIAVVAQQGRANLVRFDAVNGEAEPVTTGDRSIIAYVNAQQTGDIVLAMSTPLIIGDLYFVPAAGGRLQRLTNVNEKLWSKLNLTAPEEIWYTSFDGRRIQAWVQKPPDFDKTKKYPLILNIHGGPHAAYGWVFDHEFQWMAAKGYVVLYPNPRGSTSYGQEFGNIIQYKYPGDDFKDLMAGVDELIKRGYVDEKRLGVTGGSGGGLLTNWVVGHTDRFAAAVSQRDIASWAAWWYADDFTLFQSSWFRKPPFEDAEDYAARSPISYIENVMTPMMFILGDADWRTPPAAGGEEMFRALKYRKVPAVMVRFPGESHELSRSGQPWHRVERLEHIVNWFDIYLQGKKIPGYAPGQEGAWKSGN